MNTAHQTEDTHKTKDAQTRLWNGPSGHAWVEAQALLDRMFEPFQDMLVDAVRTGRGGQVLDVGCGTGATTRAVARALGTQGSCTGIDISEPMIATARIRAERERTPARFIRADAQTYDFATSGFDMILSRFGVMFFDDPVRAFANLRHAAKEGADLRLIAWRGPSDNPFMTAAERAAAPLLPNLPARREGAPGQFAFADRQRVRSILGESGWGEIDIQPLDVTCILRTQELVGYFTRLGPVGLALQEVDERTHAQVVDVLHAAFEPYVDGADVRFNAACWMIGARATEASAYQ